MEEKPEQARRVNNIDDDEDLFELGHGSSTFGYWSLSLPAQIQWPAEIGIDRRTFLPLSPSLAHSLPVILMIILMFKPTTKGTTDATYID